MSTFVMPYTITNSTTSTLRPVDARAFSGSGSNFQKIMDEWNGATNTDFYIAAGQIKALTLTSGSTVTTILDEDTMTSNSDTALATQQSIRAYVAASAGGASLYKNAMINGNFDIWTEGDSFTDPANATLLTYPSYQILKDDGAGAAPVVNVDKESTEIPDVKSMNTAKFVVAAGTVGAGMYWKLMYTLPEKDWQKFKGQAVSVGLQAKGPTSGFFKISIDDGVSVQEEDKVSTTSWANYAYENVTISSSATKLTVSIFFADATRAGTAGTYYIGQCKMELGIASSDFSPKLVYEEYLLAIGKDLAMNDLCADYITSAVNINSTTIINTTFTKTSADKRIRVTVGGSFTARHNTIAYPGIVVIHSADVTIGTITTNCGGPGSMTSVTQSTSSEMNYISASMPQADTWIDISSLANGSTTLTVTMNDSVFSASGSYPPSAQVRSYACAFYKNSAPVI